MKGNKLIFIALTYIGLILGGALIGGILIGAMILKRNDHKAMLERSRLSRQITSSQIQIKAGKKDKTVAGWGSQIGSEYIYFNLIYSENAEKKDLIVVDKSAESSSW